jgi:ribosomal protein L29
MAKEKVIIADYRKLDQAKLMKELDDAEIKLQDLRNQLTIGKLKNYSEIHALRRAIARMQTVRNEKFMLEAIQDGQN